MRLRVTNMLRSSIYLKLSAFGLEISGLRRVPLKMMMNSRIPRNAPCWDDPGRSFLVEVSQLYLMYIDLSVRYKIRINSNVKQHYSLQLPRTRELVYFI